MSSVTSYCPALRGSCGGGYEGGVHLFTPRRAGAREARGEQGNGEGGNVCARGVKQQRERKEQQRGNTVSIVKDNGTTTQHQFMLKTSTRKEEGKEKETFLRHV